MEIYDAADDVTSTGTLCPHGPHLVRLADALELLLRAVRVVGVLILLFQL